MAVLVACVRLIGLMSRSSLLCLLSLDFFGLLFLFMSHFVRFCTYLCLGLPPYHLLQVLLPVLMITLRSCMSVCLSVCLDIELSGRHALLTYK
jgi:hypothetical protein